MSTIEIDFEVYKALTLRRSSEEVSYNDVLRELLGLKRKGTVSPTPAAGGPSRGDWIVKGVRFPESTEFRATYKGREYLGRVEAGALFVNGQRFESPSAAAVDITGNPVNGWIFWECRFPGSSSWTLATSLRK